MDNELIKTEPLIVTKETTTNDSTIFREMKLDKEEKPQFIEEFTSEEKTPSISEIVKEEQIDETTLHTCCYCGNSCTMIEMVKTPTTDKELRKWINILGRQCFSNFTVGSLICRSHLVDEFGDSMLIDFVGMNNIVKTKIGARLRCCYCGKKRMRRTMTTVPRDEPTFIKWVAILGEQFNEHFQSSSTGHICQTHFDTLWIGNRPKDVLPFVDLKDSFKQELENKAICGYCGERKKLRIMTMVPQNPNILKQWSDTLGEEFCKSALLKKFTYICQSHLNEEKSEINFVNVKCETKDTCAYCGKSKDHQGFTKVPQNPIILKKWGDILGEDFYRKAQEHSKAVICRNHFDVGWTNYRPSGLLPHAKVFEMLSKEVKEDEQSSEVRWSPVSPVKTSMSAEIKLEESYQKPLHLLNDNIKSESEHQDTDNKEIVKEDLVSHFLNEVSTERQEGPSDFKRAKLEVKGHSEIH